MGDGGATSDGGEVAGSVAVGGRAVDGFAVLVATGVAVPVMVGRDVSAGDNRAPSLAGPVPGSSVRQPIASKTNRIRTFWIAFTLSL
jgi:hypothetical protein